MRLTRPVRENLLFLIAEAQAQAGNLRVRLETGSQSAAQRLLDRRGYAYNLKMRIHDGCSRALQDRENLSRNDVFTLRAAEAIGSELEWMTDLFQDTARQSATLKGKAAFPALLKTGILDDISEGLDLVRQSLGEDDSKSALRTGETGRQIIARHQAFYQAQLKKLQHAQRQERIVVGILIAARLQETGQVMLDISEALISARFGQRMHLDRFNSLESAFEDLGVENTGITPIAETKSGSGISGIHHEDPDQDGFVAVFKDGQKDKLKEERESVEAWHEIFPGLAPKILSWRKRGNNAALLIEHLPGLTFEQILLNESEALLKKTLRRLGKTLKAVWRETRQKKTVNAGHMAQLRRRLPSVQAVHGDFDQPAVRIGNLKLPSLNDLITRAEAIEEHLSAPFAVYIHGDFNLDNIIFDPDSNRINFIDLHRSCYSDYSQDISVFMISNYRLQVMDAQSRARIRMVIANMHAFALDFAQKQKDTSFESRLALGLARSFITSTRFILDRSLARDMYLRGIYILERFVDHHEKPGQENGMGFTLPVEDLF